MAHRDLVVIGASAGGIEALQYLLAPLPSDLDAAVLIVLHTSRHSGSLLPQILQRTSSLTAVHPEDHTPIKKGMIYIAPPDHHLIVQDGSLRVIQGPRENLHRPAIDPLFRSAARYYGPRAIGIILTGSLDDGTAGLMVLRSRGGAAIVQDPQTAVFSSMPRSALKQVPDAQVLPLAQIPATIVELTQEEVPVGATVNRPEAAKSGDLPAEETRISELDMSQIENEDHPGTPSAFGCPDCGGVLWEINESGFLRYRCRVGHAYTARNLGAEQRYAVETALWSALRALEESASMFRRMAERASGAGHKGMAEKFEERVSNTSANARVLRDFLVQVNSDNEDWIEEEVS
ncbi:MAG: chemotaxis protein CheB [Silvibacterium sp.]|nr:chemotaxis protein CheB [Silvibacterium sp.]